jgi:hypothetical protein
MNAMPRPIDPDHPRQPSPRQCLKSWPCALARIRRRLEADERGAVMVEHLITFVPVMYFFLSTLQLLDLLAADIVIKTAAQVAARSAAVILTAHPDDFGGVGVNQFSGARASAVTRAASRVLAANSHFDRGSVRVEISNAAGNGPVKALVRANYQCRAPFVNIVCGGSQRELRGAGTNAYFSAPYPYE